MGTQQVTVEPPVDRRTKWEQVAYDRKRIKWNYQNLLTELRRDSSFFGGTFGAERGFDRTLAKTEAPTELAQLVIVSRRTLTMCAGGGASSAGH